LDYYQKNRGDYRSESNEQIPGGEYLDEYGRLVNKMNG